MASRFALQAKVALDKAAHPDRYCPERRCLWRTGGDYCPRHADILVPLDRLQAIHDAGSAMQEARTKSGARPAQARFRDRLQASSYGLHAPSEEPAAPTLQPLLMREPDAEWRPLLTGLDGGAR